MNRRFSLLIAGLASIVLFTIGCVGEDGGSGKSKGQTIKITYDRPPEIQISEKIKHLAVQEFAGEQDHENAKWAQISSDKLSSALEQENIKQRRFDLVDRQGLKKILDERDLQTAFSNPEQAAKHAGALKTVDAIIYGSVRVDAQERTASRMTIDFANQRPKKEEYTKLYCQAIVNFTMVDVASGTTLATMSTTENYDSDKDEKKGGLSRFLGGGGLKPSEQCVDMLLDRAVGKFIAKISPHTEAIEEKLAKCKSKAGNSGNRLALEDDYDGALEFYLRALKDEPADHGSMFNAGLMYEIKGDFVKALEFYSNALSEKDDQRYSRARARVRDQAKVQATQPQPSENNFSS